MSNVTDTPTIDPAARIAELEAELAEARREIESLRRVMLGVAAGLTAVADLVDVDEWDDPVA